MSGPADVIHCHDWQTALVPVLLRTSYGDDPLVKVFLSFSPFTTWVITDCSPGLLERVAFRRLFPSRWD